MTGEGSSKKTWKVIAFLKASSVDAQILGPAKKATASPAKKKRTSNDGRK
jgi:hypothetical protein